MRSSTVCKNKKVSKVLKKIFLEIKEIGTFNFDLDYPTLINQCYLNNIEA